MIIFHNKINYNVLNKYNFTFSLNATAVIEDCCILRTRIKHKKKSLKDYVYITGINI